jgi:two-component system, response regulator PdtaR
MTDQTATGVLVVEQDQAVLQLLGIILCEFGYKSYQASTMDQALTLCEQHQPRIGLIDADVLDQDGVAALARLKTLHPCMRFCLVNAGSPFDAEQLNALGVAHNLLKPFSLPQLAEILADLCKQ